MGATCRSRSRFGHCGRPSGHGVPHAVPVGDEVWFGYMRGGGSLGYGRFAGNVFEAFPPGHRVSVDTPITDKEQA